MPKYAVAEYCLPDTTLEEDLALTLASGATGISVLESKLRDGEDEAHIRAIKDSGLAPVTFSPRVITPLPAGGNQAGPADPDARVAAMCDSVRRFATYRPDSVLVFTGFDADRSAADCRRIVVEGLREVAAVAAQHGLVLALEPIRRDLGINVSIVLTIPETLELIDEIGAANVEMAYDVYHLWDTPDLAAHTRAFASRFRGVHVSDWRQPTRSWMDRAIPGEGIIDLPAIFGALEAGGYDGWYYLETPSDDGRYGHAFPDSLWKLDPAELLARGKAGFDRAWAARRVAD